MIIFISFTKEIVKSIESMDATRLVKDTILDMVDNKFGMSITIFICGGFFVIKYLLDYVWKLIAKK